MIDTSLNKFRCVVHGSFGRHFEQIRETIQLFKAAKITVVAPRSQEITAINGSFLLLEDEEELDPVQVELRYLHNLSELGPNGFSYFVNPGGYIGKSAAYEIGIAQSAGVPCYFSQKPKDIPLYVPSQHIVSPHKLVDYLKSFYDLPTLTTRQKSTKLHKMFQQLIYPGSIVAAGGIIEYRMRSNSLPEILLVKTHKWGNRYSIVGGKVRHGERLHDALLREMREETGLQGDIKEHIATFDQIKQSGYYRDFVHHMFVDYSVSVTSRKVRLNHEAQSYVWAPAEQALAELDIEPNAAHTLETYLARSQPVASF